MQMLHDAPTRIAIKQRVTALRPDATRRWGKMSADQMLHHVNLSMEAAVGRLPVAPISVPLPGAVIKTMVLRLPWMKGSPTAAEFVSGDRYDFAAGQARCLALIDEIAAKPLSGPWPRHHIMNDLSGAEFSALQRKHLDHHLKQFGV